LLRALLYMGTTEQDHIDEFARALLGTGLWLCEISAELAHAMTEDAYPGEEPGAVVVEMAVGTIRTALAEVDRDRLLDAIELIDMARERVLEHLELALELSKRMHGEEGRPPRRAYG
jgi:hypothetical protein